MFRSLCADGLGLRTVPGRRRKRAGICAILPVIATTRYRLNYTPCSRRPATNPLTRFFSNGAGCRGYQHTRCVTSLPLDIQGTAFQQQAWQVKCAPRRNRVINSLPRLSAKPTAVFRVASACGANNRRRVILCHRVVRRDGKRFRLSLRASKKRSYCL